MRSKSLLRSCVGLVAAAVLAPLNAHAATIDLDTYQLQSDTPNQQVQVFVNGSEAGPSFALSIGDSAGVSVPKMRSNVDLFAETSVFSINNMGYVEVAPMTAKVSSEAQYAQPAVATQAGPATLDTPALPLASTTTNIDSAGFPVPTGGYARVFENPVSSPTRYRAIAGGGGSIPGATLTPFSLASAPLLVAPEPASVALLGLVVPAMLLRRRGSRA